MSLSKKTWHVKGLCGRCFICLRPPPILWPHTPPPLTHCIRVYSILIQYSHRERGRANQRKGERGNSSQSRSKIPTWLTVSPVYKLYKTPVQTTFRIWCLYSYLVHARRLTPHLYPTSEGSSHAQLTHSFTTGSYVTMCMYIQYVNHFKTYRYTMFFFSTNAKLLSIYEMYKCTEERTSHENFRNSIPCTSYTHKT